MNERDQAKRFNDLLEGRGSEADSTPAEVLEALETARSLARPDFRPDPARREELRAQLLAAHPGARRRAALHGGLFLAARSLAVVAVIIAAGFLFTRLIQGVLPQPAQATEPPVNLTEPVIPTPPPSLDDLLGQREYLAGQMPYQVLAADSSGDLVGLEIDGLTVSQLYRTDRGDLRLSQSPATGETPMKATEEVDVRGKRGWWVTLNVGTTLLYWEEGQAANILSWADPDAGISADDLLVLTKSLQPVLPTFELNAARQRVEFPLLTVPADYPELPLTPLTVQITYPDDRPGPLVLQIFETGAGTQLTLQQRAAPDRDYSPPAIAYTEMTVRGVTAYLMGGPTQYTLAWVENGVESAISAQLQADQIVALAEALEPRPGSQEPPVVTDTPGPKENPEPGNYTYPTGSQINLARDLNLYDTVALDIALYYTDLQKGPGYEVMHIVNDPGVLGDLINFLDLPITVGEETTCQGDYELTFRLADGSWVTLRYGCGPGGGAMFKGVTSQGQAIQGVLMITADAKVRLDPLLQVAESRRDRATPPAWESRIDTNRFTVGPFNVDEWVVLDPGPYAPYSMEFRAILPESVFAKREGQRTSESNETIDAQVTVNGQQVTASIEGTADGKAFAVVTIDGQEVYRIETRIPAGSSPLRGLWAWQDQWVMEVEGHIVINGEDLTETLGVDETFDWQIMNGAPFYFTLANGKINALYNDQAIELSYDQVNHNTCCEAAAFDVGHNNSLVWFYALRGGYWRYVEMELP